MSFKKQDIVLVPFPFSDKPYFKKRPAVIISNESHSKEYGKYICLAITSQEKRSGTVRYEHKMYKAISAGLIYNDQWVLPDKIFSIESKIILKKIGVMDENDYTIIKSMLSDIL